MMDVIEDDRAPVTHAPRVQIDPTTPLAPAPAGFMNPTTIDEAIKVAEYLANSTIVPKDFQGKPGNVLVAIQWGQEVGLTAMAALQNIAVINGRPSLWGDAIIALVRASGALVSILEELDGEGDQMVATCTVTRRGETPVSRSFSMDDAKKANLAKKEGPWQQYPKRMLQLRARGFALRDVFPDVLKGLYVAEEARDMPPAEPRDITPKDTAAPKTRVAAVKEKVTKKIAAPKDDGDQPSMDDRIRTAMTERALKAIGEEIMLLETSEQDRLRDAFVRRRDAIRIHSDIIAPLSEGGVIDLSTPENAERMEVLRRTALDLHADCMALQGE